MTLRMIDDPSGKRCDFGVWNKDKYVMATCDSPSVVVSTLKTNPKTKERETKYFCGPCASFVLSTGKVSLQQKRVIEGDKKRVIWDEVLRDQRKALAERWKHESGD